jgi:hypothetical protein
MANFEKWHTLGGGVFHFELFYIIVPHNNLPHKKIGVMTKTMTRIKAVLVPGSI